MRCWMHRDICCHNPLALWQCVGCGLLLQSRYFLCLAAYKWTHIPWFHRVLAIATNRTAISLCVVQREVFDVCWRNVMFAAKIDTIVDSRLIEMLAVEADGVVIGEGRRSSIDIGLVLHWHRFCSRWCYTLVHARCWARGQVDRGAAHDPEHANIITCSWCWLAKFLFIDSAFARTWSILQLST